jgi:hypothetical protein
VDAGFVQRGGQVLGYLVVRGHLHIHGADASRSIPHREGIARAWSRMIRACSN